MKPNLLAALKYIALQGGTRHSVHISSSDLASMLEVSQQSASRYLIQLFEEGHIDRKLAQGGQIIGIKRKIRNLPNKTGPNKYPNINGTR